MPRITYKKIILRQFEQFIAASLFELIFDSNDYWHDGLEYSERRGLRLAQDKEPGPEHARPRKPSVPLEIFNGILRDYLSCSSID
jgi:hypothetical protein